MPDLQACAGRTNVAPGPTIGSFAAAGPVHRDAGQDRLFAAVARGSQEQQEKKCCEDFLHVRSGKMGLELDVGRAEVRRTFFIIRRTRATWFSRANLSRSRGISR